MNKTGTKFPKHFFKKLTFIHQCDQIATTDSIILYNRTCSRVGARADRYQGIVRHVRVSMAEISTDSSRW